MFGAALKIRGANRILRPAVTDFSALCVHRVAARGHFMKTFLTFVATALLVAPAFAANIGVNVAIGDPDFYGHITIGDAPPPVVVYREPMVIVQPGIAMQPIYLRVQAGHAQNWRQHCGQYGACGRPVYFVQDSYYQDVYAPHHRKHHGKGNGKNGKHGNNGKGNK